MPSEEIPIDLRRVVLPIVAINSDWDAKAIGTVYRFSIGKDALALLRGTVPSHRSPRCPVPRSHETIPAWLPPPVVPDIDLEDYKGRVLYPDATGNFHALYLAKAF